LRIPHVYVTQALRTGELIDLDQRAAHHVSTVLRLRRAAPLTLFDGRGTRHHACIEQISRDGVTARIGAAAIGPAESALRVTLAAAVTRAERMDYLVQKAVELGVARIVPLLTARTVVQLEGKRAAKRQQHWQSVAISAAEQCGRDVVPGVSTPLNLARWLAEDETACLRTLLDAHAQDTLGTLSEIPTERFTALVGPEGGFTEDERNCALDAGYHAVRMGPRTLRAETAGVTFLAVAQAMWGDLMR
jgi:16S rRNA (uracil1498-N3)-methyltransferase